jgi:2-haloacid dehalogenase
VGAAAAVTPVAALDLDRLDVLTFDCYGTLIDWETGILAALGRARPEGWPISGDALLERFAAHEARAERGPYRRYRHVLADVVRGIASDCNVELFDRAAGRFAASVADWPPFPDAPEALRRLAVRYRLGVITNCDDDLFAASNRRLGVRFDWVVTAEQVGAYKPARRSFEVALARVGGPPERVLHVAQSLYHDHVPAKALGLATVWIDRRLGRPGSGATPPAEARPDLTFPTLEAFADAAVGRPAEDRPRSRDRRYTLPP